MLHHPADQRNKIPKVAEWNQQLLQKNLVAIEVVTRSSLYIQTIIRSRPVRLERSLYGNCRSQGLLSVEVSLPTSYPRYFLQSTIWTFTTTGSDLSLDIVDKLTGYSTCRSLLLRYVGHIRSVIQKC
ncbi:hypothetical protein PSTT_13178 [Puccinia striiformis]|uniref:Uncharacterized protein n=1 Tax=Puccinia striiformis TaxID=27350 RepID=A0A2S4UT15_9BASI|nr:hypothetical protein PSTT_13178 [Puccinia striiformis]